MRRTTHILASIANVLKLAQYSGRACVCVELRWVSDLLNDLVASFRPAVVLNLQVVIRERANEQHPTEGQSCRFVLRRPCSFSTPTTLSCQIPDAVAPSNARRCLLAGTAFQYFRVWLYVRLSCRSVILAKLPLVRDFDAVRDPSRTLINKK